MAAKQTKTARAWQFFFGYWTRLPPSLNASLIRDTHRQ